MTTKRPTENHPADDSRCPDCGGVLDVQRNVVVDEPYLAGYMVRAAPLPRRRRIAARVAFCNACEYVKEM